MTESLRDALERICDDYIAIDIELLRETLAAHPVEPAQANHSWSSNGVHYQPAGGAHVVERCHSGCPAEPAGVSDEAVEAGRIAFYEHPASHGMNSKAQDRAIRAALEAAQPFMQPRPGATSCTNCQATTFACTACGARAEEY